NLCHPPVPYHAPRFHLKPHLFQWSPLSVRLSALLSLTLTPLSLRVLRSWHGPQMASRFVLSSVPPFASATIWSTSLASVYLPALMHGWHRYLSLWRICSLSLRHGRPVSLRWLVLRSQAIRLLRSA